MEISLAGKVALVTGAGPNIGSGIALALARYGARVACNDLSADAAKACVRRIERNDGVAMAVTGDVSDEDDVTAYLGEVLERWGRIDILINNAAVLGGRGLLEENLDFFNRAVTVAAAGNFLNSKHAAIAMIERGIKGSIVSILSSNAWRGHRLRIPQGRAGQLRPRRGHGPGPVRHPRQQLLAHGARAGQPGAACGV